MKSPSELYEHVINRYGQTLQWVLKHQTATLIVTVGTLVFTISLFIIVPKGFFPVQDTGVILGISDAPQTISFNAMAQRQQALAQVILQGSRRRQPLILHRHRRNEYDSKQRANSNQPEVAETSAMIGFRNHSSPPAAIGKGGRHHPLHATHPGPDGRGSGQPHAISIFAGIRDTNDLNLWVPRLMEKLRTCLSCATLPTISTLLD